MIKGKCLRGLERVERELKSGEELDVDVSEVHPLSVLYEMVSPGIG